MVISYEVGVDAAPVQEQKGKGRRRKLVAPEPLQAEPQPTEPAPDAQPAADATAPQEAPRPDPERKPRTKRGNKAATNEGASITLGELARRYVEHLAVEDKSPGTQFSYSQELRLACKELHEDAPIALLTVEDVRRFFTCDKVMKLRSGKPKAQPSIDKSRRVLRLALVWAAEKGWIPTAPIPEQEPDSK